MVKIKLNLKKIINIVSNDKNHIKINTLFCKRAKY